MSNLQFKQGVWHGGSHGYHGMAQLIEGSSGKTVLPPVNEPSLVHLAFIALRVVHGWEEPIRMQACLAFICKLVRDDPQGPLVQ